MLRKPGGSPVSASCELNQNFTMYIGRWNFLNGFMTKRCANTGVTCKKLGTPKVRIQGSQGVRHQGAHGREGSATGSDWSTRFNHNTTVYQYRPCTQRRFVVPAHYTHSVIQRRPITRAGCTGRGALPRGGHRGARSLSLSPDDFCADEAPRAVKHDDEDALRNFSCLENIVGSIK